MAAIPAFDALRGPDARAAFISRTSSTLVDCSTESSAGVLPSRMTCQTVRTVGMPAPRRTASALSENRQLHQRERGAATRAVRVSERLAHFVMVVARRLDQFDALVGSFDGGGEIARLTLEFRRLVRPIGHDDRSK